MPETLGLLAGWGKLPALVIEDAKLKGFRVAAVLLEHMADQSIGPMTDAHCTLNAGKLGSVIKYFRDQGARRVVMAGKVFKGHLFEGRIVPDLRAMGLLMRIPDKRDDTLINAIAGEFAKDGMELLDMKTFCADLIVQDGVMSRRPPSRDEQKDIAFGFRIAKGIGDLDIGQTVVVKDGAVIAVEAIEGTDEAIRRSGSLLAKGGAVIVKVARPKQDLRFDLPTVGLGTLEAMREARALTLALEAGKTLMLQRAKFLSMADELGIAVVGTNNPAS